MNWFNRLSINKKVNIVFVVLISFAIMFAGYFTFMRSMNGINTTVETSSKEINKQIILNYESYFEDVRNLANFIEYETLNYDAISNPFLQDLYEDYTKLNTDTLTISLLDLTGNIVVTSASNYIQNANLTSKDWFYHAVENDGIFYFSSPHRQDVFFQGTELVISISKVINYNDGLTEKSGILLIDLSTDKINLLSRQTNLGEKGHMVIISDTNQLISSTNSRCFNESCASVEWIEQKIIGSDYTTIDGNDFFASINTIHGTRWRIATFVDVNFISTTRVSMFMTLLGVLATTILVSSLGVALLTRQITLPLNKLTSHMKDLETDENFHEKVSITGQKEVVILANAYNQMIEEIKELMDRLVAEQKDKRKTEFIALQTQINPHFLYNTLDSLIWLSEQGNNEKVIEMVVALSKFFRISISRGRTIIPIEKELEHVNNYLLIQKMRYSDSFQYKISIEDGIAHYGVVKLILQPIIENAIYHGVNADYDGFIDIRVMGKNDSIVFEVENNGYGLAKEQIDQIYESIKTDQNKSVGLKNVYQRIKIYYGDLGDLEIESTLDEKTIVRIIIPKQEVSK